MALEESDQSARNEICMPTGILMLQLLTTVPKMFYNSMLCQTKSCVIWLTGSIMECLSEMVKEARKKMGWNSVKHEVS